MKERQSGVISGCECEGDWFESVGMRELDECAGRKGLKRGRKR